jgi:hypothetical protein
MAELSGSLANGTECVVILRFLAGLEKTGRMRLNHGAWDAEVALDQGRVISATAAGERGLPALELILLAIAEGEFVFETGAVPASQSRDVDLDGRELWPFLFGVASDRVTGVPSPTAVPYPVHAAPARTSDLSAGAVAVLRAVDGRRTVKEMVDGHGLVGTVRALDQLQGLGLITFDTIGSQTGDADRRVEASAPGDAAAPAADGRAVAAPAHARGHGQAWGPAVRRSAALMIVAVGSVLLALPGYQRVVNNMLHLSGVSQGWGGTAYVDVGLVAGLSYWAYPAPKDLRALFGGPVGGALVVAENLAVAIAFLLAAFALVRCLRAGSGGRALASIAISYAALLVYLRFISPYPYGYFKAVTFAALAWVPLVAEGLALLWSARIVPIGRLRLRTRSPTLAIAGTLIGLVALNTVLTVAAYFDQTPGVFTGSILPPSSLELRTMADRIPPGEPVFVSQTPPLKAQVVSAVAFFLRDHPLYGQIDTLESTLDNPPPRGEVVDYGVLAPGEDPLDRGYEPEDLVWSNAEVKLYRRGDIVAQHSYPAGTSLTFRQGRPLDLALTAQGIGINEGATDAAPVGVVARQLIVEMGTLEARTLRLAINGQTRELVLRAGVSRYTLESTPVPAQVTLVADGGSPVFVRSLTLRDVADAPSSLIEKRDVLVAVPTVQVQGTTVHMGLRYAGADAWTDRMYIGVNVGGSTVPNADWAEFGWWGTELGRPDLQMDLDLATRQVAASNATGEQYVNSALPQVQDGDYIARVGFWEYTQASLGWQSPGYYLFVFQVRDGQVRAPQAAADPVIFLPWRSAYAASVDAIAPFQSEVTAIRDALPASASMMLGPDLRKTPSAVAALTQALTGFDVAADFLSGARYLETGHVYDFAILNRSEDPEPFGYEQRDRLMATEDFAVYRRGASLAYLHLGDGGYPRLAQGQPLTFQATAESLTSHPSGDSAAPDGAVRRQLTLTFASLTPSTVAVTVGNEPPQSVNVPAGVSRYQTETVAVPTTLAVAGAGEEPAFLLGIDLGVPVTNGPQLIPDPDVMLVSTRLQQRANAQVGVDLQWAGGRDDAPFYAGVNLNGVSVTDRQWFAGSWWGLELASRTVHLDIDLETHTVTAGTPDGPLPVTERLFASGDGDYTAQLSLWEKDLAQRGWLTPFIPLFTNQVRDGHVTRVVLGDTQLAVVSLLPPDDLPTIGVGQANPAVSR